MELTPNSSEEDDLLDTEELGDYDDDMVTDVPSPAQQDLFPESFPSDKLEHVLAGLNRLPSWVVYPLEVAECLHAATAIAREGDRCGAANAPRAARGLHVPLSARACPCVVLCTRRSAPEARGRRCRSSPARGMRAERTPTPLQRRLPALPSMFSYALYARPRVTVTLRPAPRRRGCCAPRSAEHAVHAARAQGGPARAGAGAAADPRCAAHGVREVLRGPRSERLERARASGHPVRGGGARRAHRPAAARARPCPALHFARPQASRRLRGCARGGAPARAGQQRPAVPHTRVNLPMLCVSPLAAASPVVLGSAGPQPGARTRHSSHAFLARRAAGARAAAWTSPGEL